MGKIVGFRGMSGTSKKGNPYSGYMVYFTQPFPPHQALRAQGDSCDSAFVPDSLLGGQVISVGADIELSYDKQGFLREVIIG